MIYQLKELSIEVLGRCAMNCIHCSSGSSADMEYADGLSHDEIIRLIDDGADLGATVLSLSGGEPILLGQKLCDYMVVASDSGYDRVLLYTTGIPKVVRGEQPLESIPTVYGLDYRLLEAMDELGLVGVVTIIFSMHSHQAQVHDYIMGVEGSWHSIHTSILLAIAYGFSVEIHAVPMLPNYKDMPALFAMCQQWGVDKLSLLRFVPQTRGGDNNRILALNVDEFVQLQQTIDALTKLSAQSPDLTQIRAGCPIDFRHTIDHNITRKMYPCHAGNDLILVRPDGGVHPCAAWKSLPETDNVRDKSLREIWERGEVFQSMRHYHEMGWRDIDGPCRSCRYQPTCKSGCPAQRMHALKLCGLRPTSTIDDLYIDAADPLCPAAHALVRL